MYLEGFRVDGLGLQNALALQMKAFKVSGVYCDCVATAEDFGLKEFRLTLVVRDKHYRILALVVLGLRMFEGF